MPRGESYGTERIDRPDTETGVLVRQITSFPLPSLHLHYETPTFTPDGERMLFVTRREPTRDAPWDLVTAGSDGTNLVRLSSEAGTGVSNACLSLDGEYALYMEGPTCHRTRLDDASDEELGTVDGASHRDYYRGSRSWNGRYYFSMVNRGDGMAIVRWDLDQGGHDIVAEADGCNHPKANPGGPEMQFGTRYLQPDGSMVVNKLVVNSDTLEPMELNLPEGRHQAAHAHWLGRTGKWHTTFKPPGRGVQVLDRVTSTAEIVAEGPYFWHSGCSMNGEWIVADTNWPDEGLWLINVATKKRELICHCHSSQGHPQYTHPHANLSDDGSMAVFTSDRTGVTQVYVAYIPQEMRDRLSTT